MDKAPDAFRTISEVADEIDVPQHVLRFWETRFQQIRPMKRGGGRRYYRPDDVDLLRGVRHLLYGEGYTIRGVQRIMREQGAAFVQDVWRAGAEPPPPEHNDDKAETERLDETEDVAAARPEPNLFALAPSSAAERIPEPPHGRPEPTLEPRAASVQPRSLGVEGRRKLQDALDELAAARQIIETALAS
ncbi:MAG: MerR family transcriptional regulator [Xanthobacteraceae bacterium]